MIFTEPLIFDLQCKYLRLSSQVCAFGPCLVNNTWSMLSHITVSTGKDATIREMAEIIKQVIEYEGELTFVSSKSDGMSRKLNDVARLNGMGWKCITVPQDGLKKTYDWYVNSGLI